MSQRPIPSKINNYNVYNDNQGGRLIGVGAETTLPPFESMAETVSGAASWASSTTPPWGTSPICSWRFRSGCWTVSPST